ncbi:MAG: ABC transporter permease subunit [Thiobacillus sp.]
MNIFWHEIRAHWKGLIGWSIGILITIVSGMAKFEGYSATGTNSINQLISSFPKPLMAVFGMTGLDLTKLIGYFGVLYLYVVLVVAIHAGLLGAEVIAEEERDKTSEFLFAKPVSRINVMTQKLLAALVNILIVFGVTVASSIWIVDFYNKGSSLDSQVMMLMWGVLLFQLLSFAFGIFFAGVFRRPKMPATAVTVVILTSYIISVIAVLNTNLDFLNNLTPFWYFGAPKIIADGHLDPFYVTVSSALIIAMIMTSYLVYNKRDLKV